MLSIFGAPLGLRNLKSPFLAFYSPTENKNLLNTPLLLNSYISARFKFEVESGSNKKYHQ